MILNDIVSDYEYVYNSLDPCKEYFLVCCKLINNYFTSISSAAGSYFKLSNISDGNKNDFINKIKSAYSDAYDIISEMITLSFPFYGAMSKLEEYPFKTNLLQKEVFNFIAQGKEVITATNQIIKGQLQVMKTDVLLPKLIHPLQDLMQSYYALQGYYFQLKDIDASLFEKIPEEDTTKGYNSIELRSLKPSTDFLSFSQDVSQLASFINQFERLKNPSGGACKIYTQRIESGSIRIVLGSCSIELKSISEIIRAVSDGIKMFRITSAEVKLNEEKTRQLKLQNDAKELAIINSQINNIAQHVGLSRDNPEDVEKIQKLCLPLVRYLYANPVGIVGDYKYDLNNDLKLIEQFYNEKI